MLPAVNLILKTLPSKNQYVTCEEKEIEKLCPKMRNVAIENFKHVLT